MGTILMDFPPVLAKVVNLQVMDDKRLPIAPFAFHPLVFNCDSLTSLHWA